MERPRPTLKLTYEDYLHLPEDGKRHELIDGEHYVSPAPSTKHQAASMNLSRILGGFVREQRLGRVYAAPTDVVLSDVDVVEPDLLFVAAARAEIITEKNLRGAPDLAVEILSETTRRTDEVTKRHPYERFRVTEYWVVDPELETVKVHRLAEAGYRREAELPVEAGDALTTPLFPGLAIPLAEIFE